MQRRGGLLLVLLAGLLAAVAGKLPPETCDSARMAFHINIIPDPVTAADRPGRSCAVVRSGVDSSLAATGGVTPCLCNLGNQEIFSFTGLLVEEVPDAIYAPCGGQHVEEARRLAATPGCRGY